MAAQTLLQLRTRALQRADMVNSQFIQQPDEANGLVNIGGARLHDILATTDSDYFLTRYTLTLVNGQDTYALPTDFYKVTRAFLTMGTGTQQVRIPLRRFSTRELAWSANPWIGTVSGAPVTTYRVMGSNILFEPPPQLSTAWACELWYVPQYVPLVNDTDTLEYPGLFGWDEFIVLDAAINMRMKEESDASQLMARQMQLQQQIEGGAPRDAGEPTRVADVCPEGDHALFTGMGPYGY